LTLYTVALYSIIISIKGHAMAKPGDTTAKLTKDAKAMIQLAFEDLGGVQRLTEWANNPANIGQFYTQIWCKIIPKDIKQETTGQNGGPVRLLMTWETPEEALLVKATEPGTDDD
jgi:hypothetical protein